MSEKYPIAPFHAAPISAQNGQLLLLHPKALYRTAGTIFHGNVAEQMKEYVQELHSTPREKFRTTIFGLFGDLLRRIDMVTRLDEKVWYLEPPDPEII